MTNSSPWELIKFYTRRKCNTNMRFLSTEWAEHEYMFAFLERRIKFFCSLRVYKDFFRDFEIFITDACVLRNFTIRGRNGGATLLPGWVRISVIWSTLRHSASQVRAKLRYIASSWKRQCISVGRPSNVTRAFYIFFGIT